MNHKDFEICGRRCHMYVAGYSLSGLFALWAFMESDVFDGAASCSGSLWFHGWMKYMKNSKRNRDGIVYLSLGSKETFGNRGAPKSPLRLFTTTSRYT